MVYVKKPTSGPLLIAHRGDTISFPENTPSAFESAFREGADGIELDCQLLKGELIVVHNYLFDIRKRYPQLSSVLREFAAKGRIELEVKSFSAEIIHPLQTVLNDFPAIDLELTTSTLPLLPYLHDAFPTVKLGAIFEKNHYEPWMTEALIIRKTREVMAITGATVAHIGVIPLGEVTPTLVSVLHSDGFTVHYHIAKYSLEEEIRIWKKVSELGVDQCTIDDIGLIRAVRQ